MGGARALSLASMKRAWERGAGTLIVQYLKPGGDAESHIEEVLLDGEDLPEDQRLAGDVVVVTGEDRSVCFLVVHGDLWTDLEPFLRYVIATVEGVGSGGVLRLAESNPPPRWLTSGQERIGYTALLRMAYEMPEGPWGQARPTEQASKRVLELSTRWLSGSPRSTIDFGGPTVLMDSAATRATWERVVRSQGFGVLQLDDHDARTRRTVALRHGSPYCALGLSMPAERGWRQGLAEMVSAVMSIVDEVAVGGITRVVEAFPVSLGESDPRKNWRHWSSVALYPGRVPAIPEVFGWMVLDQDALPPGENVPGWTVRRFSTGRKVVLESNDLESWFADLPPDGLVVEDAHTQFAGALWSGRL